MAMGLNNWHRWCHNPLEGTVMSHKAILVVLILIPTIAMLCGACFLYVLDKHLRNNNGY